MKKYLPAMLAGLLALVVALGLRIADPSLTRQLRNTVFDAYQRIEPRAYTPAPVRVVDIDERSLARIGQWPWSRVEVADLIARIGQLGAAVVAFDMLFAEPDRTSPARVMGGWVTSGDSESELDRLRAQLAALPDNDQVLAGQIAAQPVVTGFVFDRSGGGSGQPPLRKAGIASAGSAPADAVPRYTGYVNNLAPFEAAATGNGSFSLDPDEDGIVRRVPLLQAFDGRVYPTLTVEALRVALGASTLVTRSADASGEVAFGERHGLHALKVGPLELPTTADGQLWLHYTELQPARLLSAAEVLADPPDVARLQALLADHIVLIGTSAVGLRDIRATPLNAVEPGVLIHAQALEQMLTGYFLQRPDWAEGAELLFIVLLGLILVLLMPRIGAAWCASIALVAVTAAVGASWHAFSAQRLLIDPLYPSIAVLLVYLASSLMNYLRSEREKSHIRSAFSHYLSPDLVERLSEHPDQLRLGGETRELTILFSDVRGFTSISEALKDRPEELVLMINGLMTPLSDEILKRHGTVDKYMGDCVMAFWNAPLHNPAHASDACAAALAMRGRLDEFNRTGVDTASGAVGMWLDIGIGINTGEVVVGNMGSAQRFDYSVLGDAANLASRLEGQSKTYGVGVVLGDATAARVASSFALLELDRIAVKGKREAVRIHTLVGDLAFAQSPGFSDWRVHHNAMLSAYRSRAWDLAESALDQALMAGGGERIPAFYDLYRQRIDDYRREPPPAHWDAVAHMTTK